MDGQSTRVHRSPANPSEDQRTIRRSTPDEASEASNRYRTRGRRWGHPLGDVFTAVDSITGDRVVLTLLHPARRLTAGHLDAARATANVLGGVIDASINGVIDVVPYADDRIAVITEFLNASALSQQLGRKALPAPRAVAILRQIVRALGLAHRAGVAHGALSVGSVLLTSAQGRPDNVVLTDFALQGLMSTDLQIPDSDAGHHPVTPERILGLSRTEREDLYLVGCVGYTMLTGSPPFRTGNAIAVSRRHAIEDPMPIAARLRATGLPPQGLIDVIHRCLAKDAEDRFEDMADLEAEICLAQIDAGIRTPWDDLPIPRVDEVRRRAILHGLQGQRPNESGLGAPSIVEVAESRPITVDEAEALAAKVEAKRKEHVTKSGGRTSPGSPRPVPNPGTRPLAIPPPRTPTSSSALSPPKFTGIPKAVPKKGTAPLHVHRAPPSPPPLGQSFPVIKGPKKDFDEFDAAVTAVTRVTIPERPTPTIDDLDNLATRPNAKAFPKPLHMMQRGTGIPTPVGPATTAQTMTRGMVTGSSFVPPPSPTTKPPVRYPTGGVPPLAPSRSARAPAPPPPAVPASVPMPAAPRAPAAFTPVPKPAAPPPPAAPASVPTPPSPAVALQGSAGLPPPPPLSVGGSADSLASSDLLTTWTGAEDDAPEAVSVPRRIPFASPVALDKEPVPEDMSAPRVSPFGNPDAPAIEAQAPAAPVAAPLAAPPVAAQAPPLPSPASLPAPPVAAQAPPLPSPESLPAPPVAAQAPPLPSPESLPAPPVSVPGPAAAVPEPIPAPPIAAPAPAPAPEPIPAAPVAAAVPEPIPAPPIAAPAPAPEPIPAPPIAAPPTAAPAPAPEPIPAPPIAAPAPAPQVVAPIPAPAPILVVPVAAPAQASPLQARTDEPFAPEPVVDQPEVSTPLPQPQPVPALGGFENAGDDLDDDLYPPRKPWGLWLGIAAGIGILALGIAFLRPSGDDPEKLAAASPPPAVVEPAAVVEPVVEPAPAVEPAPVLEPEPAPEPEPVPEPEPEPEPAAKKPAATKRTPKPDAPRKTPREPAAPRKSSGSDSAPSGNTSGASATELADMGNGAFNRGDYRKAASYLEKAVRKVPGNAKYRLLLGDTYFKLGRLSKARKQYVEADELGVASAARRIDKVDAKLGS